MLTPFPAHELPLEDDYRDVLKKAAQALGIGLRQLFDELSLNEGDEKKLMQEPPPQIEAVILEQLARRLGLGQEAFVRLALKVPQPELGIPELPEALKRFVTPFGHAGVNNYLLSYNEGKEAVLFDTGTDVRALCQFLEKEEIELTHLFLTHTDADHVAGVEALREEFSNMEVFVHENEPMSDTVLLQDGQVLRIGRLEIEAVPTFGHSPGGVSYLVTREDSSLCFCGDAVFSRSIGGVRAMGGSPAAYQSALSQIDGMLQRLQVLSDDSIILPGHGPSTTLAEERKLNPFLSRRIL